MRRVAQRMVGRFIEKPAMNSRSDLMHYSTCRSEDLFCSYTNVCSSQPLDIKRLNVRIVSSS
jgi:hypothetical protein